MSSTYLTSYAKFTDSPNDAKELLSEWVEWVGDKLLEGYPVKLPVLGHVTLMKYKGTRSFSRKLTWELWERDEKAFEERRLVEYPNTLTDGYRLGIKFFGSLPYGPMLKAAASDAFKVRMKKEMKREHSKFRINKVFQKMVKENNKNYGNS